MLLEPRPSSGADACLFLTKRPRGALVELFQLCEASQDRTRFVSEAVYGHKNVDTASDRSA